MPGDRVAIELREGAVRARRQPRAVHRTRLRDGCGDWRTARAKQGRGTHSRRRPAIPTHHIPVGGRASFVIVRSRRWTGTPFCVGFWLKKDGEARAQAESRRVEGAQERPGSKAAVTARAICGHYLGIVMKRLNHWRGSPRPPFAACSSATTRFRHHPDPRVRIRALARRPSREPSNRRPRAQHHLAAINAAARVRRHAASVVVGRGHQERQLRARLLQGLARRKLLGTFDYLSTVSGAHTGGWLSAWLLPLDRNGEEADQIFGVLAEYRRVDAPARSQPIPSYSRYSSTTDPRTGLLSGR